MKSTFDKKKFELNIVLPLESISYPKKEDLKVCIMFQELLPEF
jgi:hypothetical protein